MSGTLRDRVNDQLKLAMKAQDKRRTSTLRLVSAAFMDRAIQNRGTGKDEAPSEADLRGILSKMIKQRRESAETYDRGGRPELAAGERAEIVVIEEFLPKQLSEDEAKAVVATVVNELGCEGLKDMGRVMSVLKERYSGQMDFSKASAIVKGMLS